SRAVTARDEVDPSAHLEGLRRDVVTGDERDARGRKEQGRQDLDQGALPRSVRPEEPEALAPVHREVDALERTHLSRLAARLEDAGERLGIDRRIREDQNASPTETTARSFHGRSPGSGGVR